MDARATQLADIIRSQLCEKINAQGVRAAIKAVLMIEADALLLQSDVLKACGTSKDSIRIAHCWQD